MSLISGFTANVPWFLPGVAIWVVIGYLARNPVARWLHVPVIVGWAMVVSLGIVLAATLTPLNEVAASRDLGSVGCDFSRVGMASLDSILDFGDVSLNILLFIPIGVTVALTPRSGPKVWLLVGVIALPFMIEITQLLAIPLERACESGDVVDNLTGLVIGLTIGSLARSWSNDRSGGRPQGG